MNVLEGERLWYYMDSYWEWKRQELQSSACKGVLNKKMEKILGRPQLDRFEKVYNRIVVRRIKL